MDAQYHPRPVRADTAPRDWRAEGRQLSALLLSIQEDERRRIAADLHDGLGQSLTMIRLLTEQAATQLAAGAADEAGEALQCVLPQIREALAEVRRVSTALRTSLLDDLGILPTLSWLLRECRTACGNTAVDKRIGLAEHEVPVALHVPLYRIAQEALNNIVKHSAARRVGLQLERINDRICLQISDDGCGFDPRDIRYIEGQPRGLGLFSMQERAALSGGNYLLHSTPGQGTRISVTWPCAPLPR